MRDIIVAIDLETTGLNAQEDRIIEIGAVKFRGDEVIDSYRTLIDPERPIPPRVTAITGIRSQDVSGAPKIEDVLADVIRFVGDHPILGHNVGFDIEFLRQNGAPFDNPSLDTYELASVLLPTTPRYNLNALMQEMNLVVDGDFHSALTDATATAKLYTALWEKLINTLPTPALQDIVTAAQALDWRGRLPFEAALRERDSNTSSHNSDQAIAPRADAKASPGIRASADLSNVAATRVSIDDVFTANGGLARALPVYEVRDAQRDMAHAIDTALSTPQHMLIEVPPATGKSVAYLIAALRFAVQNKTRVVISTHSADRQQQLAARDIPTAITALGLDPAAVRTAVLKGRDHYLCPRRLETLRRRPPTSIEELRVLSKILVWGEGAISGDRDDVSLRGPAEYIAWGRLSAADEGCALHRCEAQMAGTCPFYRARKAAEESHLVLVTHALLMSDGVDHAEDRVLPDYTNAVLDDAHHLEDDATNALSVRLDLPTFERQLADMGTLDSGLLGDVASAVGAALEGAHRDKMLARLTMIADSLKAMAHHGANLFKVLADFVRAATNRTDYIVQVRVTAELREKAMFEPVRVVWDVLREFTSAIADVMLRLSQSLAPLADRYAIPALPDLLASTQAAARHLSAAHRLLSALIESPDANTVYWLEVTQDQPLPTIRTAPLHIGKLAEQQLWNTRRSVTLTGDTLRTGGTFDYLRDRLSVPTNAREQVIGSAIDHQLTLLYLPTDIADPQDKNHYQQGVDKAIIELATAAEGRLLALFTSYGQMRQTAQAITARLALGNISVLDQSDGTSRQALIDGFIQAEKAVMFGTKGFWEDADFPPDALAALAITRLPFAAPTEALIAARGEAYAESFMAYSVPDAIFRFRQGFERLSRARAGLPGIVIVLDKRIIGKSYGQVFIDSLPPCTIQRGTLAELADSAKRWLTTDQANESH